MKRRILLPLLLIIGLIFALLLGGFWYWNYTTSSVNNNTQLKAFVVKKGETLAEVGEMLEKDRIIRSNLAFKVALKTTNKITKIEPGSYKLSSAMPLSEVLDNLAKGPVDKWVTILEGLRVEQIAHKLNEELDIPKEEFLKYAKEGYMFPDTYLFNIEASPESIASIFRNTFNQKYTAELQDKVKAKGLTPEQGVILASLVERESITDEDRTQVAGILLKRYQIGMNLETDATVQYAKESNLLQQGQFDDFWNPITQAEYKSVVSPFNTYLNSGLPPAPIANPSLSSLNAVVNADPSTPFLYYFHDSKGKPYYAKTLAEHNKNVSTHH